jgi:hypothetical protein
MVLSAMPKGINLLEDLADLPIQFHHAIGIEAIAALTQPP